MDTRLVVEGKLKKTAIHSELKENFKAICKNTFFEQKKSKLTSLNSTLLSTVSPDLLNSFLTVTIFITLSKVS